MAPDFSIAFCLRPHEALAARMKITMFTFRERENNSLVIHNFDWFTMMWTPSLESTTLTIGVWTHLFWWDKKNWLPWYLNSCTYQDDYKDGSCEAPDQRVVDGEPAEVWVAVTLRVKTYCQTYTHTHTQKEQNVVWVYSFTPVYKKSSLIFLPGPGAVFDRVRVSIHLHLSFPRYRLTHSLITAVFLIFSLLVCLPFSFFYLSLCSVTLSPSISDCALIQIPINYVLLASTRPEHVSTPQSI